MVEQLQERIKQLEEENKRLRQRLSKYEPCEFECVQYSKDEKISIYMSYFKGRENIIANRYYHKAKQRYAYSTLCNHEFDRMYCMKINGKFNCLTCPNRDFIGYTKELLEDHFTSVEQHKILVNKEVCLGLYPLLNHNTCYLLAIDFDHGNWMDELLDVFKIARRYHIDALMERSQSGAGGHLWIFFSEEIKASKARRLGRMLLNKAMEEHKTLDISSYDRMFPNQDYAPKDGVGNLIALPLQFSAYKKGNSAFINEFGQVIQNPIAYLAQIQKMNEKEIDMILSQSEDEEDFFFEGNQLMLPFGTEKRYSNELYIVEDSMLHIKKSTCNAFTLFMLRRISSMYNPEYKLKVRLHKPIYHTSYTINERIETEQVISIPRGCLDKVKQIFTNVALHIEDQTNDGHGIDVSFAGNLRENQQQAVDSLLKHSMGMLHASAGFGKTVMALYVIAFHKRSTLIIVSTKNLIKQWKEEIDQFMVYPKGMKKKDCYIGEYSGSKKNHKGNVDIATIASLAKIENIDLFLDSYGCVIIDECHHIPAESFRRVLRNTRARYIYGFSATPNRQDGLERVLYMYCGDKRYEVNKRQIIAKRTFQQYLIPHFTNVKVMEDCDTYQKIVDELYSNDLRNFFIANDIIHEFRKGRKCIVLSERIEHLLILFEKVKDVSPNVFVLHSEMKVIEKNAIMSNIKVVVQKEPIIILATSRLLGEGFNLPQLNTLFLTLPISDKNRIEQYTGRIHRESDEKENVYVHDYVDIHIPMMENMFQKRLKAYQREGYRKEVNDDQVEVIKYIFDANNYLEMLKNDFKRSKKQIVIMMDNYTLGKIKQHFSLIQSTFMRGIKITFYVDKHKEHHEELLRYIQGSGANVSYIEKLKRFNCIIIDQKLCWYGSVNPFGRSSQNATFIRLSEKQLSEEMLNSLYD